MGNLTLILTGIISMVITVVMGIWLIPLLKKLNFGQTILEIGPRWHKDKQGTPIMGGFLFIIGIVISTFIGYLFLTISISKDLSTYTEQNLYLLIANIVMALAFAFVGFLDDYIKVKGKQNEGLTELQKLILQLVITVGYIAVLHFIGGQSTIIWIPFLGSIDFGFFYYSLVVLGTIFIVNVVNFTDGIDGLCASVTGVVGIGFFAISAIIGYSTMQIVSAALIGGCLGFLAWNLYPAKVFMGDTGSLFLGGIIVGLAFGLKIPVILIFMGFVYIIEGITVMIQTTYFKYTRKKYGEGRRIFKMTPIHHHFEMSGWSENRIVLVFTLVQVVMCLIGILIVKTDYIG